MKLIKELIIVWLKKNMPQGVVSQLRAALRLTREISFYIFKLKQWAQITFPILTPRPQHTPRIRILVVPHSRQMTETISTLKSTCEPDSLTHKSIQELKYKQIATDNNHEWTMLITSGAKVHPYATSFFLAEIEKNKNLDLLYCDHWVLAQNKREAHHKSEFSPVLCQHYDYLSPLIFVRSKLVPKPIRHSTDLYRDLDSQVSKIKRVPQLLAQIPIELAPQPQLEKKKVQLSHQPLVSIIIPFKDRPDLLKTCIDSILNKSSYTNFEIIGISNNSTTSETFDLIKEYSTTHSNINFIEHNIKFNFSALNNFAVQRAKGEHLVFMNNDIEILSADWIEQLLYYSQEKLSGAIGAKLLYPDKTIQHSGLIVGIGRVAGHWHRGLNNSDTGYFWRPHLPQNLSAVTAALLMVKKEIYCEISGFDEELAVAYNDVDFCLRLIQKGYTNIYTPHAIAYHYESISRGIDDNWDKQKRLLSELSLFQKKHHAFLQMGDPFYSPHLSLFREQVL